MRAPDLDRLRRRCGQYSWLAAFMVISVAAALLAAGVVGPLVLWQRGQLPENPRMLPAFAIMAIPAVCYLFGVWSIGRAMRQLSRGRLIQPVIADALRRVGLALGLGGVASVFLVTNLLRLIGSTKGGYLHFDVAGMTLGMIGGALFLLGGVMDQAARVQAELDEMI